MNTDVAELLRDGIDRLTSDATVPPWMADRARTRARRRTAAARTGAIATAAAVAGAAATIVSISAAHSPATTGTRRVETASYVVRHARRALAAAEGSRAIQEIHILSRGTWLELGLSHQSPGRAPDTLWAPRAVIWLYRGQSRDEGLTAAGKPMYDVSMTTATSHSGRTLISTDTGISYPARSWWRNIIRVQPPAGHTSRLRGLGRWCGVALVPSAGSTGSWPVDIHHGLACGNYRIAGHQSIDGINAIKLESALPNRPGALIAAVREIIWIDPATFLPVQTRSTWWQGPGRHEVSVTAKFRWLPPTASNLAALHVRIPQGYRHSDIVGLPEPGFASRIGGPGRVHRHL